MYIRVYTFAMYVYTYVKLIIQQMYIYHRFLTAPFTPQNVHKYDFLIILFICGGFPKDVRVDTNNHARTCMHSKIILDPDKK